MWDKIKKGLGYLWASPVTLVGLVYAAAFWGVKWYKLHGKDGDALVWLVDTEKSPGWLKKLWTGWAGHTIGNVVVLHVSPERFNEVLTHEKCHVDQCMRLGVFQPIMYGLSMVAIKLGCPGSDPYFDCPFEIDARRRAGEVVDMTSLIKPKK